MSHEIPKTDIEIRDVAWEHGPQAPHKPGRVLINGQEVLVARDGVRVQYDTEGDPVEVTLTILPATLRFTQGPEVDTD